MRWTAKPYPKVGDMRIRRFFAWRPFHCGNEVRWLERVCLVEEYTKHELDFWPWWTIVGFAEKNAKQGPISKHGVVGGP